MTVLHGNRAPRRSKRLERSRPESSSAAAAAMPPPARPAEAPVPPRKRARVSRPPYGEQDPEDGATAAPPPARRAKREGSVRPAWPRIAYVLRNRHVPDSTSNRGVPDTKRSKPLPPRAEKRDELKHDLPCSSRKKLKQHELWEAPSCARAGLEHYNSMNQGDEYELVKAVGAHSFIWGGGWLHANFLARPKGANKCVDLVPKYFFAELKLDGFGLHCASCVKIDSVESKNLGGCGHCQGKIKHPAAGGYFGDAAGGLGTSLFDLQLYEKQLELITFEKQLGLELDGW